MGERSHVPGESPARDLREGVSIRALLEVLRRHKLLVLVPTLLATGAAVAVAYLLPPRYRSQAVVAYDTGSLRGAVAAAPDDLPSRLGEIKKVLHSRELLARLADEEGLAPQGSESVPQGLLGELRSGIALGMESDQSFAVGFEDPDPHRAQRVASGLVRLFIETTRSERQQRATRRTEFLESRLREVEARLDEQRAAVEEYKERWFEEIPDQAGTNLRMLTSAQERLQEVNATINEEESRLAAIRREMADFESQGVSAQLGKTPAEARLETLRMELRQLRRRYTDQHPDVVRARAEVEELEAAIEEGVVGSVVAPEFTEVQLRFLELGAEREAIEQRLTRLREERASVRSEIATYRQRVQSAPHHETVLADMQRELESDQEQYRSLQDQLQEARYAAQVERAEQGAVFRVEESAQVPSAPFAPNRPRIALMGLLAGLGLGLGLAFVAEQTDRTYRTVEVLEEATGLPALAAIPDLDRKRRSGAADERPVPLLDQPRGFAAEQYRILATKLMSRGGVPGTSSILVTSPMGGEGKTTTAVNLSLALGEMVEEDVLLVDVDLGRPSVHKFLDVFHGNGLKRLLANPDADPGRFARRHAGISILEAGPFSPETRTALSSPLGQRIFQRLRERYRYVVVDAPPVLAVAEGLILQQMVDSILLVVRAGRTPGNVLDRALDSLDPSRLAGLVFNGVDRLPDYAYPHPYYAPAEGRRAAGGAGR